MHRTGTSRPVYSTDTGRVCPECRRPVAACTCGRRALPATGDGILRVSREKAGRGGKTVTVAIRRSRSIGCLSALVKQTADRGFVAIIANGM